MANAVREYVALMSDDERSLLIKQFEQFEEQGSIGECHLRDVANGLMPEGSFNVVIWMNFVARECYRYFALKYLENLE